VGIAGTAHEFARISGRETAERQPQIHERGALDFADGRAAAGFAAGTRQVDGGVETLYSLRHGSGDSTEKEPKKATRIRQNRLQKTAHSRKRVHVAEKAARNRNKMLQKRPKLHKRHKYLLCHALLK
jgi:hypothetical protein